MAIASIQQVAIIGGTHGNELTGVHLVKKIQQEPDLFSHLSFKVTALLANPKAIALNRRYVERDLNRCFGQSNLSNSALYTYEDQRAKAIASQLFPPHDAPTDFIIDLHSTTANMGLTLLLSSNHPFNLQLAAYLCSTNPAVKVCFRETQSQESPMLRSLSPLGCTLEVGPISPGTLSAIHFLQTEQLVHDILDYLHAWNQKRPLAPPRTVTAYQALETIDYPRDTTGAIQAMIHPDLQGQDYQPLIPTAPLFLSFSGEPLYYEGQETVYPIFINEAAYYEKQIAMVLTQKRSFTLHPLEPDSCQQFENVAERTPKAHFFSARSNH